MQRRSAISRNGNRAAECQNSRPWRRLEAKLIIMVTSKGTVTIVPFVLSPVTG